VCNIFALRTSIYHWLIIFVCCLYHGVSRQWSGFPDNPDLPPPHIVRWTEGLLCSEACRRGWNHRRLILDLKYSFSCFKHEYEARSEGLLTLSAYGSVVSPHTLDFNYIFVYSWSLLDTEHRQLVVLCVHIQWTNCCRKVWLGFRSGCHSGHIICPCQHVRCLVESLSHCTSTLRWSGVSCVGLQLCTAVVCPPNLPDIVRFLKARK